MAQSAKVVNQIFYDFELKMLPYIAIFVKQCWNAHVINYKNNIINFEFSVVKASNSCTGESCIVAGIYRPPRGSIINFIDELSPFCDNLTDMSAQINKCTLILAVDYNITVLRTGIICW